jgi:hypothetical protein
MRNLTRRDVLILLLALLAAPAVFLGKIWKEKGERHGQGAGRAVPHRRQLLLRGRERTEFRQGLVH